MFGSSIFTLYSSPSQTMQLGIAELGDIGIWSYFPPKTKDVSLSTTLHKLYKIRLYTVYRKKFYLIFYSFTLAYIQKNKYDIISFKTYLSL